MNALVSLPWYDLRELRWATDQLWVCLRGHLENQGISATPVQLNRTLPPSEQWVSPHLLFTQACGYDAVLSSREHLQIVATPSFTVPGLAPGHYQSLVLVAQDSPAFTLAELEGMRCAINGPTSHSGMNGLRSLLAPHHNAGSFFREIVVSGSHRQSLRALQEGRVDVASIDLVSYTLLQGCAGDLIRGLRTLARTASVPAPPYVTSRRQGKETVRKLRAALGETFLDPASQEAREALLLRGLADLSLDDYNPIVEQERSALALLGPDHLWPVSVGGRLGS